MKSKIIVFDFDKTLSYSDTLFGFLSSASKKNIAHPFKIIIYAFIMVLTKLKFLSNTELKHIGIILFLKGMHQSQLQSVALDYSKRIKMNTLYKEFDFLSRDTLYVISASFTEYLRPLFPSNVNVVGSEFLFQDGKIIGLKTNCFKSKKSEILAKKGVKSIDLTYTDSYSDFPLACMSEKIIIVNGDNTHECKNIEEFNSYFRKIKK